MKKKNKIFFLKYPYITLLIFSIILAYYILTSQWIVSFLKHMGTWEYLGAFLLGSFYTYSLTSFPATAAFYIVSETINPFIAAALGGLGAMCGDLIIFNFVKVDLLPELKMLAKELKIKKFNKNFIKKFKRATPIIGAIIIGSPLPDEIGVFLIGIANYETKKFMLISWLCNSLGLLVIALFSSAI